MRARRGYTLIEVLIASSVAFLVLAALYGLFTHGLRLFARGQARADLQSAGLIALTHLADEIRQTAVATLTVGTLPGDESVICFRLPAQGIDWSTQLARFSPAPKAVLYFRDGQRERLLRRVVDAPMTDGFRVKEVELQALCTAPTREERVLSDHVRSFRASDDRQGALRLELVLAVEIPGTLDERRRGPVLAEETVSTTFVPRNRI